VQEIAADAGDPAVRRVSFVEPKIDAELMPKDSAGNESLRIYPEMLAVL
jgi:hypothetical protein